MDKVFTIEIVDPIDPRLIPEPPVQLKDQAPTRTISLRLAEAMVARANPYRDSDGRFGSGPGAKGGVSQGKDLTSDLAKEYGTDGNYTEASARLRDQDFEPTQRGDATVEEIARKQGFDGKAEMVDQTAFDKIVADGGTVTYRGITDYYDGSGPDAKYITGEQEISQQLAEGDYFAGNGVYGSGTYTSQDLGVARGYASEDGKNGSVVTMAIRPGAKIATPEQWEAAKLAAKNGTGGFTGATNEGRILIAQGFDGFDLAANDSEHWGKDTTVILNRQALVVLKK